MLKHKYTLIDSNFFDSGLSYAIIQTPLGEFGAYSRCLEEDMDYASSFFGCEVAECKAFVKYAKQQISRQKEKVRALNETYKEMSDIYNFNANSPEAIFIRKKIERENAKIATMEEELLAIKKHIEALIVKRDEYTKALRAKKEN